MEVKDRVFLILSTNFSNTTLTLYNKVVKATKGTGDVFLLYHCKSEPLTAPDNVNVKYFNNNVLTDLGYTPIQNSLIPGSSYFAILDFYLKYPAYSHYWYIEYDVFFNGDWKDFFTELETKLDYDFVSSHFKRHAELPGWHWWPSFKDPKNEISQEKLISSFNPIFRISNQAIQYIDQCLKIGYAGHYEVVLPTLLYLKGFKMADLSSYNSGIAPSLAYCNRQTMRANVHFRVGGLRNFIYHPIKGKVSYLKYFYRSNKAKIAGLVKGIYLLLAQPGEHRVNKKTTKDLEQKITIRL